MESNVLRNKVLRALADAKPHGGVAMANAALAALGLDDFDAAAIRSIDAWAQEYANDDWLTLSAEGQLAVARAVLAAACTAPNPTGGTDARH